MRSRSHLNRKMKPPSRNSKPSARNSARQPSEELGQGNLAVRRHPRTGRPIRESAGKRKSNSAYVNTVDAVDDDGDSFFEASEDEEGNPKKRKRSPSPTPLALDLLPSEYKRYGPLPSPGRPETPRRSPTPDPTFESHRPLSGVAGDKQSETVNLTLNIPPGFSGPIHFTIDKTLFETTANQVKDSSAPSEHTKSKAKAKVKPSKEKPKEEPKENLILKLPAELRIKIYRNLFDHPDDLVLHDPNNFSLSSAFLRTCRTIHDEGCGILYGSNTFQLGRNTEMRAPLWVKEKKEVGYHDVRLWLHTIGPQNISRLRSIIFLFNDALPSARGIIERQFVRDDHLIYSLRMLAKYSQLHEVTILFQGRKPVQRTDFRFLDALRRVKCDKLDHGLAHVWVSKNRDAIEVLERNMVRRVEEVEE
ncbi:hypothetical protein IWX90DRAFT_487007 [Phyllosticta citrichinensis]|uniref:Uncharacterized protein n=1 Tax=Phyllosticta citrichinensis TaxID=1130410 RepID=A0ABR1XPN9_9PEZI